MAFFSYLCKAKELQSVLKQSMNNKIEHSGIVDSVEGRNVKVRILQTSACGACKVAAHCNASEAREKIVDVVSSDASRYQPGQQVVVCASPSVAARALLLAFGIPFLILVFSLVFLTTLGVEEGYSALLSLAMLCPYYLLLWLLRKSISRKVSFYIE